jgi:lysophospholipase L1-like esterase
LLTVTLLAIAIVDARAEETPSWVAPMKKVRARFNGTPGTLATFGDSITVTMAFWAPLRGEPKNMPAAMAKARALVKAYLRPGCWAEWKGPKFGNTGSMTIRWADENAGTWLKAHNPEVAVILFGTNDLGQLELQEFAQKTAAVVDRCLANGTIVILTTLPPRSGFLEKSRQFAQAVRRIARAKQVPLIDYQAEILKRRPNDWDGALPKFKDVPGSEYEVPTLIARDGVHPSNPRAYQDYSDKSLSRNGYALRNYLTLLAYAEVVRKALPSADARRKVRQGTRGK